MDSILIVRRPVHTDGSNTGLGRYADSIESCIEDMDAHTVYAPMTTKNGKVRFITDGLIRPFFACMNHNSSSTVIHATDELCAFMFPFFKGRKIITVHHIVKPGEASELYYRMWIGMVRFVLKKADDIIAISSGTVEEIRSLGIDPDKIHLITNRISPVFRTLDVPKERAIGCVAEFIPRKRVDLTIKAFAELIRTEDMDDVGLRICGKGALSDDIDELIRELCISDRVKIQSDLDDDGIVEFYNRCSLVLNTSKHEGLGICTIEAQRCGTPVLHLSDADIPEIVLKESIPCASVRDMASTAGELLRDGARYEKVRDRSIRYANGFGEDFCEKYRSLVLSQKE